MSPDPAPAKPRSVPPTPEIDEAALFAAALEKSLAGRTAFLNEIGQRAPDLRRRLEALLDAHEQPENSLGSHPLVDRPDPITLKVEPIHDDAVGQMVGRYKLLEKVGEGGCGVVYVAEQTEPVRRRVALKVIKLGMDTKQVVARFEAERQALAMMDHPNIAKVLDAGATDTGRPYFVMELVRGIRITEYCDQNNLSTKERLDLFIKVCQAIQHAHQKGIIHRDIKPSNVLVTLHDGVPVPKVIDFGIAKATEGRLTDATVYTQLHQFIGTPAYMSPEQAEMSGLDIDTRSDIYSLGVLLYELLTGKTPFDAKELAAAGIDGIRQTIREKEPPRPSTRLATLDVEELTTTAKRRSVDTSKLLHQLKGVDWIVMKCLEKDRTRRYETANGLAADLKRHLFNEPVVARPPSTAYRFQKAVRRNKFAVAGGVAVVAVLIIMTLLFVRERLAFQAMRLAEQNAAEERVYFAILSGDETRTRDALKEAEEKGLGRAKLHYLRGLHFFTAAQARQAVPELEAARALDPNNVATLGLLAIASIELKGWDGYEPFILELKRAKPVTAEDFLFLGRAINIADHRSGFDLMERALREKESPMGRLVIAGARTGLARQTGDLQVMEMALNDVSAASAWGKQSLPILLTAWDTHHAAAFLHRRAGNVQRAELETLAAERISERLELFYPNMQALYARLNHLILAGEMEQAYERAHRWSQELPDGKLRLFLLWVLLKQDRFEDCIKLARQVDSALSEFVQFLCLLELKEPGEETFQIVQSISDRPLRNVDDLFAAVAVNSLCGRTGQALQLARGFVERPENLEITHIEILPTINYLAGKIQEVDLLNAVTSAYGKCVAHHFIALRCLAGGDRARAREHFEASCRSGADGEIAHIFSEFMLKRLNENPSWPPTQTLRTP